jgi:hypothetical protein
MCSMYDQKPDFHKQYGRSIYRLEKANQYLRTTFSLWSLEGVPLTPATLQVRYFAGNFAG